MGHLSRLTLILSAFIFLSACGKSFSPRRASGVSAVDGASVASATAASAADLQNVLNQERAKAGLGSLEAESVRNTVAQLHAEDMEARQYFDHVSLFGLDVRARLVAAGLNPGAVAENLAMGPTSALDVVKGWMDSPSHKANILNSSFKRIGMGHKNGRWVLVLTD